MTSKLIEFLVRHRPRKSITRPTNETYLIRYFLFAIPEWLGGGACYVHHFLGSDPNDFGPHDHPWAWAKSLILSGRYFEHRYFNFAGGVIDEGISEFAPGTINSIRPTTIHLVEILPGEECYSLFIHGDWKFEWGFWGTGKWEIAKGGSGGGLRPRSELEWWKKAQYAAPKT